MLRALAAILLCAAALPGQAPVRPQGVAPDWDIRVILQELSAHVLRLLPSLDQVDVKSWIGKGASETYTAQMQSLRDQLRSVGAQAKALSAKPETLSSALELYFRLQAVDSLMRSLQDGIRRYQNPALADLLASLVREDGPNRERFQTYMMDMAVQREEEYAVMDHEAQRCRSILSKQPDTRKPGKKE